MTGDGRVTTDDASTIAAALSEEARAIQVTGESAIAQLSVMYASGARIGTPSAVHSGPAKTSDALAAEISAREISARASALNKRTRSHFSGEYSFGATAQYWRPDA